MITYEFFHAAVEQRLLHSGRAASFQCRQVRRKGVVAGVYGARPSSSLRSIPPLYNQRNKRAQRDKPARSRQSGGWE